MAVSSGGSSAKPRRRALFRSLAAFVSQERTNSRWGSSIQLASVLENFGGKTAGNSANALNFAERARKDISG